MDTVVILGCGTRGIMYSRELRKYPEIQVKATCDLTLSKAEKAASFWGPDTKAYTDEEVFFKEKMADLMVIATQDRDHYAHAMKALDCGYHLLLEKPLAPTLEECEAIVKKAEEKNAFVLVGHVLRYTNFYRTVRNIICSGKIGKIININHTENVGYWHFSHSYVRGPWRRENLSTPLVMAKCCHDMDLFTWFMECKCTEVSSFGERTVFCEQAAPEGSAAYCLQGCKIKEECPYDCEKIYLVRKPNGAAPVLGGSCLQVAGKPEATKEEMRAALYNGQYGKCVYHTDNTVCDHQVVETKWENGATATLTITPFTKDCYRRTLISGTKGEIIAADCDTEITVHTFLDDATEKIRLQDASEFGHLGGDSGIVQTLVDAMLGREVEKDYFTTVDITLESHKIAFAAEKARVENRVVSL